MRKLERLRRRKKKNSSFLLLMAVVDRCGKRFESMPRKKKKKETHFSKNGVTYQAEHLSSYRGGILMRREASSTHELRTSRSVLQ